MQELNFYSKGTIGTGEYGAIKIDGVVSCTGDLKTTSIEINGVFKCHGKIETSILQCDGVAKFHSDISAAEVIVDGALKATRLNAEKIKCDGFITAAGEISADIVNANGCINAKEIVGDSITINSHFSKFTTFFMRKTSAIALIEATVIELRGVTAQTVNGHNIIIGPYCHINNLDCSGTLSIDRKARVKNISGEYTVK
ncbi:MAG: hypothetical protein RR449_03785 [Christensenella sp.]